MAGKKMPKLAKNTERFKSGEEIELTEHRAMIYLPENSVEVTIEASIFEDGEVHVVSKKMNMEALRDAFQRADDGYIDEDDRFVLTDRGLKFLEECGDG